MARFDYYAVETQIKTILEADSNLTGTTVSIEGELLFSAEQTPWVGIYLERREAPPSLQTLAAGQRTNFLLRFSIWCWSFSLESIAKAIQLRDDLVGKVEISLMSNRTLGNSVRKCWLEGGEMPSGRIPDNTGFVSGAEIILVAEGVASTV
jgi:hypothetical protein